MSGSKLPFVLGDVVGRGATALVYDVELPEGGGPWVAKILTRRSGNSPQRFLREGRLLEQLEPHPRVVPVHSVGELPDGAPYMILPRIEGQTLEGRLEAGPLSLEAAKRILRGLVDALAHVHRHGVTHRDVKPANVLLDADGEPRLVDFGIALVEGESRVTDTGALVGTPRYMAPEQVRPSLGPVGPPTDVHGFGQIAYELLVGTPAFEAEHPPLLLAQILHCQPLGVRAARPEVGVALEALIARCLTKDPALRHSDGEALKAALEESFSEGSVARRVGGLTVVAAVLGALLFALLTGGLSWASVSVEETRQLGAADRSASVAPTPGPDVAEQAEQTVRSWVAADNRLDMAAMLEVCHPETPARDGVQPTAGPRGESVLESVRFLRRVDGWAYLQTVELSRQVEAEDPGVRLTQLWALRRHEDRWLIWTSQVIWEERLD